ncbi:YggS family pyridoxal phosphate-dependent enzyme [Candidatus Pelagibacter sp. HIMB1715]|uniref:YggS family pyridoxal phosphate-dependent enzyme n=1 Tax=Candidatus Pelagibacter sp. HIMB1715 TaxID=3413369 RepID=UPI003F875FFC
MHDTIKNLINIEKKIKSILNSLNYKNTPNIIAVSKTFPIEEILPLIEHGHLHFGENKVQEALNKWSDIKKNKPDIKIHLIGKLQTNKVKFAVKLFDYIHSVDSKKLAKKIADEQIKIKKKINTFIQVNIGNEDQKSGINKNELDDLVKFCKEIDLIVNGLMCIPPLNLDSDYFFKEMKKLNEYYGFKDLSMGMSSDYLKALENSATYIRIGSKIFGSRI